MVGSSPWWRLSSLWRKERQHGDVRHDPQFQKFHIFLNRVLHDSSLFCMISGRFYAHLGSKLAKNTLCNEVKNHPSLFWSIKGIISHIEWLLQYYNYVLEQNLFCKLLFLLHYSCQHYFPAINFQFLYQIKVSLRSTLKFIQFYLLCSFQILFFCIIYLLLWTCMP